MEKLQTEPIDVLEQARELALGIEDDDRVESAEAFAEHGQCWVRAQLLEGHDEDEITYSVVECGNEAGTEIWFELEEL